MGAGWHMTAANVATCPVTTSRRSAIWCRRQAGRRPAFPVNSTRATWSGDSRALVSFSSQDNDLILVRMDVETLQTSDRRDDPDQHSYLDVYRQGVWRVP